MCCWNNNDDSECVAVCGTAKPAADAVSVTSCDSSDSIQLSIVHVPASSSSSSTLSEDCSSESGKPPPLVVSIDLELLRQEEPILDLVSPTIQPNAAEPTLDCESDSTTDGANSLTPNAVDSSNSCSPVQNVIIPDGFDAASAVAEEDDFESIYSRNLTACCADQTTLEMSLDDAIMKSLMTSCPNEFRDVVRPVSFTEYPDSNDKNAAVECNEAELYHSRQISLPQSTWNTSQVSCLSSATGTGHSMLANHWVQLPAPADVRSLSVSSRHVWISDASGQLFYSLLCGPGLHWFMLTTAPAQQVSVSPSGSLVWRLDAGSAYAARNVSSRLPWGSKWAEVARDVAQISVDDHVAW